MVFRPLSPNTAHVVVKTVVNIRLMTEFRSLCESSGASELTNGGWLRQGRDPQPSSGWSWEWRLARLPALWSRVGSQPQGDVGGLHRLPYDSYEVAAQGVEIRLVTQLGREGF
jgi:hypothetical protein